MAKLQIDSVNWGIEFDNESAGEAFYNGCSPEIGYRFIQVNIKAHLKGDDIEWPLTRSVQFKSGRYLIDKLALDDFIGQLGVMPGHYFEVTADHSVGAWESYYNGSVRNG